MATRNSTLLGLAVAGLAITGPAGVAAVRNNPAPRGKTGAAKPAPPAKPQAAKPSKPSKPSKPGQPAPSLDSHPLIARLTPLESGPGLLVCEPVATGADASMADFGSGCGRWLHLVAAGQPELGKTPLWSSVEHAVRELHRHDLRLNPEQAVKLPRMLGITHVALGEIKGDARSCTLTYRLWEIPAKKPVGEPLTVTGTESEVMAALPKLAADMAAALGVRAPKALAGVGETADELRFLGRLPWAPGEELPEDQMKELARIAMHVSAVADRDKRIRPHRAVLAAMLDLMKCGALEDVTSVNLTSFRLGGVLPENALVMGETARQGLRSTKAESEGLPVAATQALLARFPNNYLLRTAASYHSRLDGKLDEARKAAEIAVRCSTGNPDAWLVLASRISDQADAIRKGRFINEVPQQELQAANRFYEEWIPVSLKAVLVDPQHAYAWHELSTAAAFVGEEPLADRAFWKATELDPGNSKIYEWGIQLYQPKWLGDAKKLEKVARMAVAASGGWTAAQRMELAIPMRVAGLPGPAGQMLHTDEERAEVEEQIRGIRKEHPELKIK